MNQSSNTTFGGSIQFGTSGAQLVLDKYGSGSLTLAGTSTLRTAKVFNAGTLHVGPAGSLSTYEMFSYNTSTQAIDGLVTLGLGQWQVNDQSALSGSGTVDVTQSATGLAYNSTSASTFAGAIVATGGNAGVSVSNGQLTLSGNNTYRGGTAISGGLLQLGQRQCLRRPIRRFDGQRRHLGPWRQQRHGRKLQRRFREWSPTTAAALPP